MERKPEEYTTGVVRYEDMSPDGNLRIHRQIDGDVILVASGVDMFGNKERPVSIEFCTLNGGGQSMNTMRALIGLIEAMKKDNEERPQDREESTP